MPSPSNAGHLERASWPAIAGISVSAPARLHFGLFSFGGSARQFGGIGLMLDEPRVRVAIERSAGLHIEGELKSRITKTVAAWCRHHRLSEPPPCRIRLMDCPALHTGLGVGTQLGLAIAAGLNQLAGWPAMAAAELAASAARGARSAVGTYGFLQGGFIVERGRLPGQQLSPLDLRLELPDSWRVVLIRPMGQGLSGSDEQSAFDTLPEVDAATRRELIREVRDVLVPAIAAADFPAFADSLYRYGHRAGECFERLQGSAYNGPRLAELVAEIRDMGARGVGQSSWGPTLFAMFSGEESARDWIARFRKRHSSDTLKLTLTRADNEGARISTLSNPELP